MRKLLLNNLVVLCVLQLVGRPTPHQAAASAGGTSCQLQLRDSETLKGRAIRIGMIAIYPILTLYSSVRAVSQTLKFSRVCVCGNTVSSPRSSLLRPRNPRCAFFPHPSSPSPKCHRALAPTSSFPRASPSPRPLAPWSTPLTPSPALSSAK